MKYTREEVIEEYKRLKAKLGKAPNSRTFYAESPVSENDCVLAFGSKPYSKLQKAAGDKPNRFSQPGRSKDEFFEKFGAVVRELQCIPVSADWKHRGFKPVLNSYRRKLGVTWTQMPQAFVEWALLKPEWADVVKLCKKAGSSEEFEKSTVSERVGYVYLMKSGKLHKIGKSKSPARREYDVGLKVADDIKTIHKIKTDDSAGVEAYWHRRFKEKRKKGEFFDLSSEDIRAFKRWKKIW